MLCPPKKNAFGPVFTLFLAYFVAQNDLFFEVILRIWTFDVAEIGDDICRYDVIFCWYLQCF